MLVEEKVLIYVFWFSEETRKKKVVKIFCSEKAGGVNVHMTIQRAKNTI